MTLPGLEVKLDPVTFPAGVPEAVGVAAVAVHETRAGGDAAVTHQDGDLVQAFGRQAPEVPGGGGAAQMGARVTLLGVDEVGELQRITDEEDGGVVADEVPVALVGIELDRKATHVTFGVGCPHLAGDGGETRDQRGDLAHFGKEAGTGVGGDIVGDGEGAEGAPALGVDDTFGDALAVLVGELFEQLPVLHQQRAARTGREAVLVVDHGRAGAGGHDGTSLGGGAGHACMLLFRVGGDWGRAGEAAHRGACCAPGLRWLRRGRRGGVVRTQGDGAGKAL